MLFQIVICGLKDSKNKHEIYHDELDTTDWMFSNEALIRVVRGWYEMNIFHLHPEPSILLFTKKTSVLLLLLKIEY